jgi:hypothetical protein
MKSGKADGRRSWNICDFNCRAISNIQYASVLVFTLDFIIAYILTGAKGGYFLILVLASSFRGRNNTTINDEDDRIIATINDSATNTAPVGVAPAAACHHDSKGSLMIVPFVQSVLFHYTLRTVFG